MPGKLTIVLGAATQDSVLALIVAQGLGREVPTVTVRPAGAVGGPVNTLIPRPWPVGPTIAPRLHQRDVRVFRVRVPVRNEVVLEAFNADRSVTRKSAPFRALPARLADVPAGLSFVLGTCTYYWPPFLQLLAARLRGCYGAGGSPAFAIWAGDNVYLDVPKPKGQRPADVVDRYLRYFLDGGYGAGRAALPSFTTYDDHEYWNDYPERALPVTTWLTQQGVAGFAAAANECLDLFQRSINPPPAGQASFTYCIDVPPLSICVIDTRSHRDHSDAPTERLMREEDLLEFESWARGLTGPGVLVLGQPLWIEPTMTVGPVVGDHNVSHFRAHYDRICRAIETAPFDILICSGDVHYSRLLRIATRERRVLHELVASPLVSIPTVGASFEQLFFGGTPKPMLDHHIEDTTQAPRAGWQARYQMGTGNGTVFAVLNFKPAGAQISVGLSFIDLRSGTPADLVRETALGAAQVFSSDGTRTHVCAHPAALTLGRRLS